MPRDNAYTSPPIDARSDALRYLEHRVLEEAEAAVRASSTAATLIHIALATAYARRFGETSVSDAAALGARWADEQRIW